MAMWITRQRLGWLSLILGVVGFTLPWASYAGYEDSYVVYEMWNGWRSMGELFIPFVSPISLLVAGVELFPIIAAVVAIALPHARKIWWWTVASSLSLLALVYHIWLTLDSAQEFGQRPEPTYYGPGLYVVALGIVFLIAALWPWQMRHHPMAVGQS